MLSPRVLPQIASKSHLNPLPPVDAFLRPRCPFRIATIIVLKLTSVGQQGCLARTLKTLATDECCVQETRNQDFSSVIRRTPSSTPSVKFHLRLPVLMALIWLSVEGRGCATSLNRTRLRAVRLGESCRVNNRSSERRNVFAVSVYS